jgi:DNA-binding response OmpR family regulator
MPQTILIVDDSPPLHELLKAHLSSNEVILESAFNGPSALVIAASVQPDLILLDIDMPDMDGFEVCRLLKEDPDTESIPIIFLTARAAPADKVLGLNLQAMDYIVKPFNGEELCARVRSALRTKRLLDLLPKKKAAGKPRAKSQPNQGRSLNTTLSLTELSIARSKNPWNRKPPELLSCTNSTEQAP